MKSFTQNEKPKLNAKTRQDKARQDKNKRRKYTTLSGCRTLIPLLTHTHVHAHIARELDIERSWVFIIFILFKPHKILKTILCFVVQDVLPVAKQKVLKRN